jgi:hypothetical protein
VTPRERVEAVARAAWGVSRVDVTVVTLPEHAVAVVSSERTTDSVPRSQTATAPTVDAALLRAADLIAGGVSSSATRATRDADAAAAEARILARLAACVACAVPCRDHVARCKGVAPCREVMPRVQIAWWLDRVAGCDDSLLIARSSRDAGDPWPYPTTIMRPLWWRRGRKGRACRDPRKHAPTCKVLS